MNLYEYFSSINEPYAAGLFRYPDRNYFYRHCEGCACFYESAELPEYKQGEMLYPDGNRLHQLNYWVRAVVPNYAKSYECNMKKLEEKGKENPDAMKAMGDFWAVSNPKDGWLHGAPNYRRIVREGLDSYEERIRLRPENTDEEKDFKYGLLRLIEGLRTFWNRAIDYLVSVGASEELIAAMRKVPFYPAETYYEGLVAWNAIFYFDGCDNLGCLDAGLAHLYNGEDMTDVIRELFSNIDAMGMWSCTIGPVCNEITRQAIRAVRNRRRPLLELRVTENTPEDIWDLAVENLKVNSTNPSFYNEKGIHDLLKERFPYIPDEELIRFCGCGCTETNLEGITHAGGTDENINLLKIFETYLYENLGRKATFDDFFDGLVEFEEKAIDNQLNITEEIYRYRSIYMPHPIRTLLWDDCIDKGRDFFSGGARYSYSMNAESGLINVIDSLAAIRKLCYDEKKYSAEEFLKLLREENDDFYSELKKCPCYGVDDEETDELGRKFAEKIFSVYRNKKPTLWFMDAFTVTEHQFSRYEYCGSVVGPTPDGRHNGEPSCDSLAALRGKAVKGPTAMLNSAAKLPQHLVDGISVVNLTIQKSVCDNTACVKGLVLGYFRNGGIQIQVTVTSPEELKDALIHPEKHEDLIVRVGGYSEYFNNLTDALKKTVVERNVHSLG